MRSGFLSLRALQAWFALVPLLLAAAPAARPEPPPAEAPKVSPFREVHPGEELYERARRLSKWGLLDPQDTAVLERGEPVTRLQLAFYTEKAKTKLSDPLLPTPTPQGLPEPVFEAPPLPTPEAPPPTAQADVAALQEALKAEAAYLRTRLSLLGGSLAETEKELERLEAAQAEIDAIARKANKQGGSPNFSTNSRWYFEDLTVFAAHGGPATTVTVETPDGSGTAPVTQAKLAGQRATRFGQEFFLGIWADLGGRGSISTGLGGFLPSSGGSVSISVGKPSVDLWLDGILGHWDILIRDESFIPDSSLGSFVRSVNRTTPRRFQDIYHVRVYSDNKLAQLWEDYMGSLGYTVTRSLVGGSPQSQDDRVFDGVILKGRDVPGFGKARLHGLVGRLLAADRFEYGAKVTRPFLNDKMEVWLAAYFVDDSKGTGQDPSMDLRNYAASVAWNLGPLGINAEGARAHFFTGQDLQNPGNAVPLVDYGGRVSVSLYPFSVIYDNVGPDYANFQSHATITSVDYARYGAADDDGTHPPLARGDIGEADMLHTNRRGFRVNFGWNGRQKAWMKESLPGFLDDLVVNFDWARKKEYRAVEDPNGRHLVEAWNMVSPYYFENQGIWGEHLYGGFGADVTAALPLRAQFISNLQAARGFQLVDAEVRYRFRFTSEHIPLVDPATGENLSHQKSFHYLSLSQKLRLNRWLGVSRPIYLGLYGTVNRVSGEARDPNQSDISNLFEQRMTDAALFVGRVLPNLHLVAHLAYEEWNSDWTVPRVRNVTRNPGVGFGYDIPWGTSKLEVRYDHLEYRSGGVPANNYDVEQVFAMVRMLF